MISCERYDYIEIACMFQYPVQLVLHDGRRVEGIAKDTKRNDLGEECIALEVDSKQQLCVLDQIEKMKAMVDNSHFDEVTISPVTKPSKD